ncbi:hypothetical protein PIB30_013085 [Stylosanthes scabra]|uniref:Uncharacterized protein n=1 Tax=Stylosanthes scabra TaxID=79078 RepID=A0ABU6U5C1_9FABA|nr:hypothetical protein [Stylosanthes scabra]
MTQADFQYLIPGNEVHSNILMLAALKTTIAQRASDETFEKISDKKTTWSLPPQFGLELLDYILSGPYSATKVLQNKGLPMDNWPFNKARGIPDCKTSDNSPVWLLEWIAMEDMFQPNLSTRPPDSKIWMLAACANLAGSHNELGHMVKKRFAARWKALVGN